jgi:predicted phage terminase large subunit-like protein
MTTTLSEKEKSYLKARIIARAMLPDAIRREEMEGSLLKFLEAAWSSIDSAEYSKSWAVEALCEHLQAVKDGIISRLLVTYPPRASKSIVGSICFPAWVFCQSKHSFLSGPQVRIMCGSYNNDLSLANSNMCRRLLMSPFYQKHFGKRFKLLSDQNTKSKFDTSAGGSRIALSVGGSLLGIGGDLIIVDDPMNVGEVQSDAERATALQWWSELSTTRLNDPRRSALVVIQQRIHEEDVAGKILSDSSEEWCHLMIPAEFEWRRWCTTSIGWSDPRGLDGAGVPLINIASNGDRYPRDDAAAIELEKREGEPFWPQRFGTEQIARIKLELGPYLSSGRLQQMPTPARGGLFDRTAWQLYEPEMFNEKPNKFPPFSFIVASLDSAFTSKESNDPSGFTCWGVWKLRDGKSLAGAEPNQFGHIWQGDAPGKLRIMLIGAWRKHLQFSAPREEIEKLPGETHLAWMRRTERHWGLLEHLYESCARRLKVDKLLIESKASGISAAQELRNRFGYLPFSVQLVQPKGDKVARAISVQPLFSQGMVYAPNKDWWDLVATEMQNFPLGKYDDLTDSATMALRWIRDTGWATTDEEQAEEDNRAMQYRSRPKRLYPMLGPKC